MMVERTLPKSASGRALPQVLTTWVCRDAHSVSFTSWAAYFLAACLWFLRVEPHSEENYFKQLRNCPR
jgi:hypothetical protein